MVEERRPSIGVLDLSHGGQGGDHRSQERLKLVGCGFGALRGEEDEFSLGGEESGDNLGLWMKSQGTRWVSWRKGER